MSSGRAEREYSRKLLAEWGLLEAVERELLRDQMMGPLRLPPEPVLRVLKAQWEETHGMSQDGWCERYGLDGDTFLLSVCRQWRWQRWCEHRFGASLASVYLSRKAALDRVSLWLVLLSDGDLAAEIYQRLREVECTVEQLSREPNEQGVVEVSHHGPVPLAEVPGDLRALLTELEEGAWTVPQRVGEHWLILQLERKYPAALTTELKVQLLLELGEELIDSTLSR